MTDPVFCIDVKEWPGKTIELVVVHSYYLNIKFTDGSCAAIISEYISRNNTTGIQFRKYEYESDLVDLKYMTDEEYHQILLKRRGEWNKKEQKRKETEERKLYEQLKRKYEKENE